MSANDIQELMLSEFVRGWDAGAKSAAARVAELEAALRAIVDRDIQYPESGGGIVSVLAIHDARAALKGKP